MNSKKLCACFFADETYKFYHGGTIKTETEATMLWAFQPCGPSGGLTGSDLLQIAKQKTDQVKGADPLDPYNLRTRHFKEILARVLAQVQGNRF